MGEYKPLERTKRGDRKLYTYRYNKKKVLKRDNYKCVCCGTKAELTHHIIPVWQDRTKVNNIDNIESLCKNCHNEIHYGKTQTPSSHMETKNEK